MMSYEELVNYLVAYMVISVIVFYYLISRIGYWHNKYHNDTKHLNELKETNNLLDQYILRDFERVEKKVIVKQLKKNK